MTSGLNAPTWAIPSSTLPASATTVTPSTRRTKAAIRWRASGSSSITSSRRSPSFITWIAYASQADNAFRSFANSHKLSAITLAAQLIGRSSERLYPQIGRPPVTSKRQRSRSPMPSAHQAARHSCRCDVAKCASIARWSVHISVMWISPGSNRSSA